MNLLTDRQPIAHQIRQRFPSFMRRGEAVELLRITGFSERTLKTWCRTGTAIAGLRRRLPSMKEYRYSREVIIGIIESDSK